MLWLPLQGPFIRLLAAAAERALPLLEHPPILTALTTRGNSITLHSYITGVPQPLTHLDCGSLHLSVVASLALALSVSAKRWSTRARVCGLALALVFLVMLAVCIVQLESAAEAYASAHLGITLYTAREKAFLDWAIRKSSLAAVYLVPALLFLTSYLSAWSKEGQAGAQEVEKRKGSPRVPRPPFRMGWKKVSIVAAGCVAAWLILVATQAGRDGKVELEGLRKIVALNPSSPRAHFGLALNLEKQGRLEQALDSYRSALRLQPGFVAARFGEGNVFFSRGAYAQAASSYGAVLEREPGNTDARFRLGTTFLNRGIFDLAARSYEEVLRVDPDHASAHKGLGDALVRLNRRCDALAHLERSAVLDPRLATDATLSANVSILRSACVREP